MNELKQENAHTEREMEKAQKKFVIYIQFSQMQSFKLLFSSKTPRWNTLQQNAITRTFADGACRHRNFIFNCGLHRTCVAWDERRFTLKQIRWRAINEVDSNDIFYAGFKPRLRTHIHHNHNALRTFSGWICTWIPRTINSHAFFSFQPKTLKMPLVLFYFIMNGN